VEERIIRNRIARGGIDPKLRREVWGFLLGVFPWDSTSHLRKIEREKNRYFFMQF